MVRKTITGVLAALTLMLGAPLFAQEQEEPEYKEQRTNKVGLYLRGGTAWATGGSIAEWSQACTPVQILGGAGLSWNIRPWVRLGLNYDYTYSSRNRYYNELQPEGPAVEAGEGMVVNNSQGGVFYRRYNAGMHGVDLSGDFNLMELFKNRSDKGWFNIYVGTGFGWMLGTGNVWSTSTGHSSISGPSSDGTFGNISTESWVKGLNQECKFNSPYVPARLSVEFNVLPQMAIGLEGGYKFLCKNMDLAPRNLFSAGITLRFTLTGKIRCRACEQKDARFQELVADYDKVQEECTKAKSEKDASLKDLIDENESLKARIEALEQANSGSAKSHIVYFNLDSSTLSDVERERLIAYGVQLSSDGMISIVGEASNEGGSEYNQKLSDERVSSVINILNQIGIGKERISSAKGIGSSANGEGPAFRRVSITAE